MMVKIEPHEFKPCPICGEKDNVAAEEIPLFNGGFVWRIFCDKCKVATVAYSNFNEADRAWETEQRDKKKENQ